MSTPILFLSHASVDGEEADAFAAQIEASQTARDAGLRVWIDRRALVPGRDWVEQLEQAISQECTAFAVYLTEASIENWVRLEISLAVERVVRARKEGRRFPFIPLLVGGRTYVDRLPPFARIHHGIEILADSGNGIEALLRETLGLDRDRPVPLYAEPFLGLAAFDTRDAGLFFGRKAAVDSVLAVLQRTNLLMVIGDSGCGKSSLVRAGVVPAVLEGRLGDRLGKRPEPHSWAAIVMRPKADPFEGLIEALDAAHGTIPIPASLKTENYKRIRSREPGALRDALRTSCAPGASRLLVIDQFEELWTQTDEAKRRDFLAFLIELCPLPRDGAPLDLSWRVVGTMRRDHYNLCSDLPELQERLEPKAPSGERSHREGVFLLGKIGDVRDIVIKPLALAGVDLATAEELASNVEKDVTDQPGDLALVEMALTETWRRRGEFGDDLVRTYDRIGRVEGALASAAEFAFEKLEPSQQVSAEALFMRLVQLGDLSGATRRVVERQELTADLFAVARLLVEPKYCRLLVASGAVDRETFEISHERLSSRWSRYHRWLRNSPEDGTRLRDKRTLDRLMDRVHGRADDSPADLSRGFELSEFCVLLQARSTWLSPLERRFIAASNKHDARTRMVWHAVISALVLVTVFAAVFSGLVWKQNKAIGLQLAREQAAGLWHQLEVPNGIEASEVHVLHEVARSSIATRVAFLEQAFATETLARRFNRDPLTLMRAVVGIDPALRTEVSGRLIRDLDGIATDAMKSQRASLFALCEIEIPIVEDFVIDDVREGNFDKNWRVGSGVLAKLLMFQDRFSDQTMFKLASAYVRINMHVRERGYIDSNYNIQLYNSYEIRNVFEHLSEKCIYDMQIIILNKIDSIDEEIRFLIHSKRDEDIGISASVSYRISEYFRLASLLAEEGGRVEPSERWTDIAVSAIASARENADWEELKALADAVISSRPRWSNAQSTLILGAVTRQMSLDLEHHDQFPTFVYAFREVIDEATLERIFQSAFERSDPGQRQYSFDEVPQLFARVRPAFALRLLRSALARLKLAPIGFEIFPLNGILPVLASRISHDDTEAIQAELFELAIMPFPAELENPALSALRGLTVLLPDSKRRSLTNIVFHERFEILNAILDDPRQLREAWSILDCESRSRAIDLLMSELNDWIADEGIMGNVQINKVVAIVNVVGSLDPQSLPASDRIVHLLIPSHFVFSADQSRACRHAVELLCDQTTGHARTYFLRELLKAGLCAYPLESQDLVLQVLIPDLERLPDQALVHLVTELFKFPRLPREDLLALLRRRFPDAPQIGHGFWPVMEWLIDRFPDAVDEKSPPLSVDEIVELLKFD